jgi:hypothetical protein
VVTLGVADGEEQVVQERPTAGLHTYVDAPLAVSTAATPSHLVTLLPADTVGDVFTVTVTVAVREHPLAVPVTVYVVVVVGLATGLAQVVQDKPVDGAHE